ncbi:GNAT family N-acetyltransferase [Streptomyces sp. NPDC059835]|uniref:GNAT family N-acetyltransferase n=1 Tax=Streptomyces sp. NPDC059835 TaxID=3346967 RepID=UPI003646E8CB
MHIVIELRETRDGDLDVFWEQLTDPGLRYTPERAGASSYDREHFDTHWAGIRRDPAVTLRTVVADGAVVGYAAVFGQPGGRQVTHVIGVEHRGRGIASRAVAELVRLEGTRPLYAGAVADSAASVRVLVKCGFTVTGRTREFVRSRGEEVDVLLLTLDR